MRPQVSSQPVPPSGVRPVSVNDVVQPLGLECRRRMFYVEGHSSGKGHPGYQSSWLEYTVNLPSRKQDWICVLDRITHKHSNHNTSFVEIMSKKKKGEVEKKEKKSSDLDRGDGSDLTSSR